MKEDTRMSPEEAGKAVIPERTARTVRTWCREGYLSHTKDGQSGAILISRFALKKFCKNKGIQLKGNNDDK